MAFSAFSTNPSVLTQTVGGPVIEKVYSVSSGHTFALGEGVYLNTSGQLAKARADALSTSYTIGVVKGTDTTTVTVGYQGEFSVDAATTGNFPLVTGSVYYLSPSLDGGLTTVSPVNSSQIVQPLFVAKDSYSAIIVNSLPRQNYGFTSLFTPVGTLVPYGGRANNVPSNWLLCAGDCLAKGGTSTDPYYDLYSAIGEKYHINGIAQSGSTGTYAYINFDGSVEDAPSFGTGLPGSTKNHSLTGNDVYKITWGTKEAVASVYSAVGTTSIVVFQFLTGITGATNAFTGLFEATEVTVKSLVPGEAAGYTSDKFFLPDLRGRMAIGAGRGVGLTNRTVGGMGGEETHTLTLSEIPSHRHNIGLRNSESISGSAQYYLGGVSGGSVNAVLSTDLQTNSAVSDLTGGGNAHQNMSPFISTNWIIRYKDNRGLPGIEMGPKGEQGVQGIQGNTGPTGARGATGVTGYASGTISYRYTGISTPPNGYWTENAGATGYLTVSSLEDSNVNISSYIETWDDSNSTTKGVVFIRDAYNSPSFFRIYNVTGSPVTGDTSGIVYYTFPVTSVVASGTGNSGQAYSFMFIRAADNGSNGVNGVTGEKGETGAVGAKGETGSQGVTGVDGTCGCPVFSPPQEIQIYVDPNSTNENSSILSYSPYNFSGAASQPTSFTYFKNRLQTNAEYGYDEFSELRYPVPVDSSNIVKYNFNYSITGATPCDEGNCVGATSYYNFVNSVRLGDSSVPPTQMSMILSANKTYRFDQPVVIKDCAFGIFAQSGSYFSKIPTGLSASFDSSVTGSTGRDYLNIDVYTDTNNVSIGNYLSIKPEHFGLTSSASVTGYQTLCGIYKINGVDYVNDIVSVQGRVVGGSTGARMFTGSLTYPNISTVDIYTTVVEFHNSSGFFVEPTGTLMLGKTNAVGATGDPFVVVHSGGLTSYNYAKGIYSSGGKAYVGNAMAFHSWPQYGAALYATNSGFIRGEGLVGSSNGTFAYADSGSRIILTYPILTRNNSVMIVDGGKMIISGITGTSGNRRFLAANNESVAMILNSGSVDITDKRPQIITDSIQAGFLVSRASFTIQGMSGNDGAFIGATGRTGTRGISLNNTSIATIELDNVTIRSSVTGNSSLGVTKRIGAITSVYSATAPIVAGGNFGNDDRFGPGVLPPLEGEIEDVAM